MEKKIRRIAKNIYYGIREFIFDHKILEIYAYGKNMPVVTVNALDEIKVVQTSGTDAFSCIDAVGDYFSKEKLSERLRNGDIYFLAFHNEKPIHFSWVSFRRMDISEIRKSFRLKPDQAYIYHCFTNPEYRGRGVYPLVLSSIAGSLRKQQKKEIFISTLSNNQPSIKGILKAGFGVVSRILYFRIMGIKLYFYR